MRTAVLLFSVAAALATPMLAAAQASSPVTGNMAIVSDYRFRGISQTFELPAIQGGIDYAHESGVYLGNWNSSISGLSFNDTAGIEMDFYGGWKKSFGDIGLDIGLLQYYYPGAKTAAGDKYDTLEGYIGVSWKWLTAKYSHAFSDFFGLQDSDGSGYLDLGLTVEVAPKLNLVAHFGMQTIKNYEPLEYNDWKLGLTYDLNGWILGAAYIDTDADSTLYTLVNSRGKSKDIGGSTVVLSVLKTF
ncbi:MAG TPA: TorF family putative porin [Burkholderiales bacterium]|nr:TorF family putative porin [Burkholderiales bacterium]